MPEEKLIHAAEQIKKDIKTALINRDMTQVELAELIGEGQQQLNRAIRGDTTPKSVAIRKKIYKVLNLE